MLGAMDGLPTTTLPRALGVTSNPPGATFGPRVLADHEFVWMVEGRARYRWRGREFDVPEGAVVLCRPTGEGVDAFDWDGRRTSRHAWVHFSVASVPAGFPDPAGWPTVRELGEADVWRPLYRHLRSLDALPPTPERNLLLRSALAQMLGTFVLGLAEAGPLPEPDWPEPVRLATRFYRAVLERDPSAPVTLADLARAAGVTRSSLCRAFRRAAGVSPLEAVRNHRLDKGLAMMTRSNEPVGDVASACGFATPFHFSRSFKATFGRSPSEARSMARAGRTPPLPAGLVSVGRGNPRQPPANPDDGQGDPDGA